jgi:hypothetical protein
MHGLPEFVDGSCRREPDLESRKPSITALCRAHMFVPRLKLGDEIVYITVKSTFGETSQPHNRLVAQLQVIHISPTHDVAAQWYSAQELPVPSNCMVTGNRPKPYDQTSGRNGRGWKNHPESVRLQWWDGEYRKRAKEIGCVVHCEAHWIELENPPRLDAQDFRAAFGYVPGTRTPPELPCEAVHKLVDVCLARRG